MMQWLGCDKCQIFSRYLILFDFIVEHMQNNGTISLLLIEYHVINFG